MKKTIVCILITVLALLSFTACEKEDPDNFGTNEISFSDFEFDIPDYYEPEPVEQTKDTAVYMRPKEKDMCQLIFKRIPFDGTYSLSNKEEVLNAYLDTLGLANVDRRGGNWIDFSGEKDGVMMEGRMDSLYVSNHDDMVSVKESEIIIVTALYREDKQSPYYYGSDTIDVLYSAAIDGYEGAFPLTTDELNDAYNSGSDSESNGWDTDNNGAADWQDVDTNNDGDVSQDEMNDYLEDWNKE